MYVYNLTYFLLIYTFETDIVFQNSNNKLINK